MKKEIWKPVRGKEEYAEISNLGQIHYYGTGRGKYVHERFTYGCERTDGYFYACIGGVNKGVHVWVFMTFNDCDIPKGYDVNHLDENHKNNRLDNLNLLSHGDNIRYGTGIARSHATQSKAVQALDKNGNVVYEFPSTQEAERQGFNSGHISACCLGKRKTHKGFIWKYKE